MSVNERQGSCLCGKVKIAAKIPNNSVAACHCSMCRKWGGGPFMAVDCQTDVTFTGEQNVSAFSSSDWAERGFCRNCGTHLFYRLKDNGQYFMPMGLFEDDGNFVLDHQVFIDEKPACYDFANKTLDMTGAEVFAQFAPPT